MTPYTAKFHYDDEAVIFLLAPTPATPAMVPTEVTERFRALCERNGIDPDGEDVVQPSLAFPNREDENTFIVHHMDLP